MTPALKNQREAEKETRATRSSVRSESGLLQSIRPTRKSATNPNQTTARLIVRPPNAPSDPRAIPQATCGPVHAVAGPRRPAPRARPAQRERPHGGEHEPLHRTRNDQSLLPTKLSGVT